MADSGRRQMGEHQTGHFSGQHDISAVSDNHLSATSKVILRRIKPADIQTKIDMSDDIHALIGFCKGRTDTLTLYNVEVVEQTTVPGHKLANHPRQEDHMDTDSGPVTNTLTHSTVAAGDAALLKKSPDRTPGYHQETPRKRAMHARSLKGRRRFILSNSQPSSWGNPKNTHCKACYDQADALIHLGCGHSYCRACLNQLVSVGLASKSSWPPKCCYSGQFENIDFIIQHLDEEVISRHLSVNEEYSARDPVYCSNKFCSRYMGSGQIPHNSEKFVSCTHCRVQTCVKCKQGRDDHVGVDGTACKSLEELMDVRDRDLARNKQWKQCPGCGNLVERVSGCNVIYCPCGEHFCYVCGESVLNITKWKKCRCSWSVRFAEGDAHYRALEESRRWQPRMSASGFDSSGPDASSPPTSLPREQLPLFGQPRLVEFPRPHPRNITHPQTPSYSPLARIRPEWRNIGLRNEQYIPYQSIYGDSEPVVEASNTGFTSNPTRSNATWSAAPPISPAYERPPWPPSFRQFRTTRTSSYGNPVQPLTFTPLPDEPETWISSTLDDFDPNQLSGYTNQPRVDHGA